VPWCVYPDRTSANRVWMPAGSRSSGSSRAGIVYCHTTWSERQLMLVKLPTRPEQCRPAGRITRHFVARLSRRLLLARASWSPRYADPPISDGAAGGVPTNSSKRVIFPICFSAGRPLHSLCAGWLARRLLIARSEGAPPLRGSRPSTGRQASCQPTRSLITVLMLGSEQGYRSR